MKSIVILGPTATGKTELSLRVSEHFSGEIVNADSMQVYSEMSIGTAKPSLDELLMVKHHLIGIIGVDEDFSVSKYRELALPICHKLIKEGKIPIIVGGTGLYINSLFYSYENISLPRDEEYREKLYSMLKEIGNEQFYKYAIRTTNKDLTHLHPNDTSRIIRALEMKRSIGTTPSTFSLNILDKSKSLMVGINYRDRKNLYSKTDQRIDKMLDDGLIEEVRYLLYNSRLSSTARQAIGYKELIEYINGDDTLDNAIEALKRNTRRYAKRQITWFKRDETVKWFYVEDFPDKKSLHNSVIEYLEGFREKM